ncbi:MAG: hypothetical protein M3347_12330 [Armatimonadota bacterium]|nr:hypothetical protein [Armatimonadota bacterium]
MNRTSRQRDLRRWLLPALVTAYAVLTLLLIVRVPMGAAPDEMAHIEYVQYLATQGGLPIFRPLGALHPGYEFHQPPLYYALCASLYRAAPDEVRNYLCRLVSLLCGAATLVFLWHSVVALFPQNRELPVLATGFAALWPMHQGVGASAGNDALAGLVCAASFWVMARGARRPWQTNESILLGALIGLGLLTKNTCLVIAPAALGAAWMWAQRSSTTHADSQGDLSAALKSIGAIAAVALVVSGWWLWRNTRLYGDPLALRIFDEAFSKSSPRPGALMTGLGLSLPAYLRALLLILFATTWGFFGGPNTAIEKLNPFGVLRPTPEAAQAVLWASVPMLTCAAATVVAAIGLWRWMQTWRSYDLVTRTALLWWLCGFVLVLLAWVKFNIMQYQAQARYLHAALLPMALGGALGWQQALGSLWKGHGLWIGAALLALTLVGLTLWNAFGWRTLV